MVITSSTDGHFQVVRFLEFFGILNFEIQNIKLGAVGIDSFVEQFIEFFRC